MAVNTVATTDTWRDLERWECGSQYKSDHRHVETETGGSVAVSTTATTGKWRDRWE